MELIFFRTFKKVYPIALSSSAPHFLLQPAHPSSPAKKAHLQDSTNTPTHTHTYTQTPSWSTRPFLSDNLPLCPSEPAAVSVLVLHDRAQLLRRTALQCGLRCQAQGKPSVLLPLHDLSGCVCVCVCVCVF